MKSNKLLVDNHFELLRGLSKENKIALIARLANSLVEEATENEKVVDEFYGAFKSEKSAEELIGEIHETRTFNRTTEVF